MPQPDSESERDDDQERKPRHPPTVSEQGWTVLVTGAVLLVGLLSVWGSGPSVEDIERTRARANLYPDRVRGLPYDSRYCGRARTSRAEACIR